MDWTQAFSTLAALILSVRLLRTLRRVWKFTGTPLERRPVWWPGDNASWRGATRVVPLAIAFVWFLALVVTLGPLVPEQPKDTFGFVRPAWFSLPVAVVGVAVWPGRLGLSIHSEAATQQGLGSHARLRLRLAGSARGSAVVLPQKPRSKPEGSGLARDTVRLATSIRASSGPQMTRVSFGSRRAATMCARVPMFTSKRLDRTATRSSTTRWCG